MKKTEIEKLSPKEVAAMCLERIVGHPSCDRCKYSKDIDDMPQYKRRNKWEYIFCTKKNQLKHYPHWTIYVQKCFAPII